MVNKSRGRPSVPTDTRERILTAARHRFAGEGYARTSLRAVARDADVDHALVSYYFGSKEGLFKAVTELVFTPAQVLDAIASRAPAERFPRAFLRTVVSVWDAPDYQAGMIRLLTDALSSTAAQRALREYLQTEMIGRLSALIGGADARQRAAAVAALIGGLFLTRYVLNVQPIASMSTDEIVDHLAPAFDAAWHPPRSRPRPGAGGRD